MAGKKKTGKPSPIQGKRAEFLGNFYSTYTDASKGGKTRPNWSEFFKSYWAAFPWRLPLTQDPDASDPTDYERDAENEEEEAQKTKTIAETEDVSIFVLRRS
jgi:hypothetical protein